MDFLKMKMITLGLTAIFGFFAGSMVIFKVLTRKFGELLIAVADALEDGKISKKELVDLINRSKNLFKAFKDVCVKNELKNKLK